MRLMKAKAIINAIDALVVTPILYKTWTIGVTDDLDRRRAEHKRDGKKTSRWRYWNADTERDARAVERHFLARGMQGGSGGAGQADYVYVF